MGLRFSRVAGWGWVAEIGGCIAGCAHPFEESATNFRNASTHRLFSQYMNLWKLRLLSARKAILVTVAVTLGKR
jgi:hypothetical protein